MSWFKLSNLNFNNSSVTECIPPLCSIDYNDPEEFLDWARNAYDNVVNANQERITNELKYTGLYKGLNLDENIGQLSRLVLNLNTALRAKSKLRVNQTSELVNKKLSNLTRLPYKTEVLPDSAEYTDINEAKTSSKLLDSEKYLNRDARKLVKVIRRAIITGNGYELLYWNERAQSVGKILPYSWDIFLDPQRDAANVKWFMWRRWEHVALLQKMYSEKADKIKPASEMRSSEMSLIDSKDLAQYSLVIDFYHITDDQVDNGLYCRFTPHTCLVEPGPNPIPVDTLEGTDWKNLPLRRITAIDVDGDISGQSDLSNLIGLQLFFDNLMTLVRRNTFLQANPTTYIPEGSVDPNALKAAPSYISYSGPQAPTTVMYPGITPDTFNLINLVDNKMQQQMGISGVSRGTPPPGTRSTSQMTMYEEQEAEAASDFVGKIRDFVEETDQLQLVILGKNLKKERTILTLGRGKRWEAESFDPKMLTKPRTVKVKFGSGLPEGKIARSQFLFEMMRVSPNALSPEQLLEAIDIAQPERLFDAAETAVSNAEWENENLQEGLRTAEPIKEEDHLTHLKIHYKLPQHKQFKSLPDTIRAAVESHIKIHEYCLWLRVQDRARLVQQPPQMLIAQLAGSMLPLYPLYFIIPSAPMPMMPPIPPNGQKPPQEQPPAPGGPPQASQALAAAVSQPGQGPMGG